jgi:hypothetical protein
MRTLHTMAAVAGLVLSVTASVLMASAQGRIEPLPRDLEIQLALSALPRHLRDDRLYPESRQRVRSRPQGLR